MKKIASLFLLLIVFIGVNAQTPKTPDVIWGKLFEEVQLKRIFPDNKTFVDAIPRFSPEVILKRYETASVTDSAFDLKRFITNNFILPQTPSVKVEGGLELKQHLEALWKTLQRSKDLRVPNSSLLPLPKPYIVPGGRFREIYYWDSYFTMLGLVESRRLDLVENMLDNFKFLIDEYGHIPNGNRSYYLSRSQPPFFALMVDLLAQQKGPAVYKKYYTAMEKEYKWWMDGEKDLGKNGTHRRVVKLKDGSVLNRYWDDKDAAREESFAEDVASAKAYKATDGLAYTNLRAGAESGWDFSSRWFRDTLHLTTIETTNIIPVDLNSLLYSYENILSKAAATTGNKSNSGYYKTRADKRKKAIQKYCWNNKLGFYFDYHFVDGKTTDKWSAAGAMPLFSNVATKEQAAMIQKNISAKLLKDGGIVTTIYHTGQQWDAPNGWAPLQFITVKGLMNYNYTALARTIGQRWMLVNEKVFANTGKMLEKYNVENTNLESGGGEYPTQDGFGWSNGVYLKFHQMFKGKTTIHKPAKAF